MTRHAGNDRPTKMDRINFCLLPPGNKPKKKCETEKKYFLEDKKL